MSASPEQRPSHEKSEGYASEGTDSNHGAGTGEAEKNEDLEVALQSVEQDAPPYSIFSTTQKNLLVAMATVGALFSPLSANIYFPALNQLSSDFQVSSSTINLTITTYMILQGIAPTFIGNFADNAGRRPALLLSFTIYVAACIGCALAPNFAALLVLRMIQSTGSSGTIALASAIAADISVSSERGKYIGWALTGSMLGPALGPILGGVLAQFWGWRGIFWFLTIFAGVVLVIMALFLPETCRKIVGNGSIPPQPWNYSIMTLMARRRQAGSQPVPAARPKTKLGFPNPFVTLKVLLEKDASMVLLIGALTFAAFFCLAGSLPYIFSSIYHYDDLQVGLCFIPFGAGCITAPPTIGRVVDWNYRRVAKKHGFSENKGENANKPFPVEEARIPIQGPLLALAAASTIIYGWMVHIEAPLAAPLVFTFFMGYAYTAIFNVSSVLLVDYYPQSPATATAANNLTRCLLGAAATALIIYMIEAMGRGWCFTFVGLVLALCMPLLWVLFQFGPRWREERRVRLEAEK